MVNENTVSESHAQAWGWRIGSEQETMMPPLYAKEWINLTALRT